MSGFDPRFDFAGVSSIRDGIVPAPGNIDGASNVLYANGTWGALRVVPPGPVPPPPGPALDQWACNAAGFLIYACCYKLVKSVVDSNFFTLATNAIIAFCFDSLAEILVPLEILDPAFLSWLESTLSPAILSNITTFEAHLLDQVLWSKFHCFLYDQIRTAGLVSNSVLLAAGVALAASGISPSQVTDGVALILQQFGIMSVGPVPLSAFVQNYDCSTCAGMGTSPAPIPIQPGFDLRVTDGTNTASFVDILQANHAVVGGSGNTATLTPEVGVAHNSSAVGVEPNLNLVDSLSVDWTVTDDPSGSQVLISGTVPKATSSTLGIVQPDNTTVTIDGSGIISAVAGPGFANPMTAQDDIIIGGSMGAPTRLAAGASGDFLGYDPVTGHVSAQELVAGSGIAITQSAGQTFVATAGTGAGGTACTRLGKVVIPIPVAAIDFTSIATGFSMLLLQLQGRSDFTGATNDVFALRMNGDTASNYNHLTQYFSSGGGGQTQAGPESQIILFPAPSEGAGSTPHTTINTQIWLPNYDNTTFYKTVNYSGGMQDQPSGARLFAFQGIGSWNSLAAINHLQLFLASGNWEVGTIATLWGFL
jgi:hypothetical protein